MSLKIPFRDSWEVWRSKVNQALGGSVEDIKASEVTFDGTTSSLSATNVQSAIDEVAGNIPEIPTGYAASAITYDNTTSGLLAEDVQSAIDEVSAGLSDIAGVKDGYVYKTLGATIILSGDGVKKVTEMLDDLADAVITMLGELGDDEYVEPKALYIGGIAWCGITGQDLFNNETTSIGPVFSRVQVDASVGLNFYFKLNSGNTSAVARRLAFDATPTISILDYSTVDSTDGGTYQFTYNVLKKV